MCCKDDGVIGPTYCAAPSLEELIYRTQYRNEYNVISIEEPTVLPLLVMPTGFIYVGLLPTLYKPSAIRYPPRTINRSIYFIFVITNNDILSSMDP